jgi:hypothetical protein
MSLCLPNELDGNAPNTTRSLLWSCATRESELQATSAPGCASKGLKESSGNERTARTNRGNEVARGSNIALLSVTKELLDSLPAEFYYCHPALSHPLVESS